MAWGLVTNPFLTGFFGDQKREEAVENCGFCAHFNDTSKELSEEWYIAFQLGNLLALIVAVHELPFNLLLTPGLLLVLSCNVDLRNRAKASYHHSCVKTF